MSRNARRTALAVTVITAIAGGLFAVVLRDTYNRTADPADRGPTAYDRAVTADGPSFYWPLDETTGAVRDVTGHASASTETSGRLGVPGVSGTGAFFAGPAQRIRVPPAARMNLAGSFSVEMWLKPAGPATGEVSVLRLGTADRSDGGITVSVSSHPTRRVLLTRNGTAFRTYRGLTTDSYRQLVFTYDASAGTGQWFIDGAPDARGALPGVAGPVREDGGLQLGGVESPSPASGPQPGGLSIDAVSIYPDVLPAGRVEAHYRAAAGIDVPDRYVGGVAVGGLQPWNTRRDADYQAMRRANMTWLRSDLGWQYLEPAPGEWKWELFDEVVADATAAGLNYLAILHTVPGWANGNRGDYAPPASAGDLTNYCYRTARHYLPLGVTDYQIGNEVNLIHPGWSEPDGKAYVRSYLVPCVTGVRRAARELNAAVNVMLGSLAPHRWTGGADPVRFLTAVYQNGGGAHFDSVSWHPYAGDAGPGASGHMTVDPRRLHAVMLAKGDGGKQIWATEFGYPTGGPWAVSEGRQAAYVKTALDIWYSKGFAGPLLWYSGRDTGTDAGDREQHFGLLRYNGSAKRAYAAVAACLTR